MSEPPKTNIGAVQTALQIVEFLEQNESAGITQIANKLPVSKSTVYNHLDTLRNNGYVVKNSENEYQVGLRFLETARAAKSRYTIRDIVDTEIEKLADKTGEIIHFGVAENGVSYNLSSKYGDQAVETPFYEGYHTELHVTAAGKAILSTWSEDRVHEYVDEYGLRERTENSITDRDELLETLEDVRERGVAFNHEENISGLVGVGVPLSSFSEDVAGALSILGPSSRISQDQLENEYPALLKESENIIQLNSTQL